MTTIFVTNRERWSLESLMQYEDDLTAAEIHIEYLRILGYRRTAMILRAAEQKVRIPLRPVELN